MNGDSGKFFNFLDFPSPPPASSPSPQPPLTNAVFMGMGEPMDNPAAVQQSLEVLTHPHAFAMAKSKISVSTVGPSPGAIKKMISMPARLAWSVHAAADEVRRLLVPTTVYSMVELRWAFVFCAFRKLMVSGFSSKFWMVPRIILLCISSLDFPIFAVLRSALLCTLKTIKS